MKNLHFEKNILVTMLIYGIFSAVAFNFFLIPSNIFAAGVNGFAQVISLVLKQSTGANINVGLFMGVLNLPLFIYAWFKIGKKFTILSVLCLLSSMFFLKVIPIIHLIHDPLISVVIAGIILGLSTGACLFTGISTGGLDIVSILMQNNVDRSIGTLTIILNLPILFVAAGLFGLIYSVYGVVYIFVYGKTCDWINASQEKVQLMIITEHSATINAILHELGRGVTSIGSVEGTYQNEEKSILLSVISGKEWLMIRKSILDVDPDAFISVSHNVDVVGTFSMRNVV